MKIYNGTSWNESKALKFYNGSNWTPATKGWFYNGSNWTQHYPNYPFNYYPPLISGTEKVGSVLSVSEGLWTQDAAYLPTSYSYKWQRDGIDISGATTNQYTVTVADAGKYVRAVVTATNARGVTSQGTYQVLCLSANLPSPPTLTDSTTTPSIPSTVSVSGGTNAWSASWTNTGAPSYGVRTDNGSVSYSGGTAATGSNATAGSATVHVKSINTNGTATVQWTAASGATQYNVSWAGSNSQTVYGTSTTISWPTGSYLSVTVTPMVLNGGTAYGSGSQSNAITLSQKESNENSGTTNSIINPTYPATYVNFTENGFTGSVLTYPNNNTYTYPSYIARPGQSLSITSPSSDGTGATYTYEWQQSAGSGWYSVGNTTSSYTIPSGQGPGGMEYRCAVTATVASLGNTVTATSSSTGAVVNANGTTRGPLGGSWSNNISPTGGTLYITEPLNSFGVGSSFDNWNYAPAWGYDIYIYRSTTSGGTYTQHSNTVKGYNGGSGQTQTKTTPGWYYAIVYTYNGNSINGGSLRIPTTGGYQLT